MVLIIITKENEKDVVITYIYREHNNLSHIYGRTSQIAMDCMLPYNKSNNNNRKIYIYPFGDTPVVDTHM